MRKIEAKIIKAIKGNKEFNSGNNHVYWKSGICYVKFHRTDIVVIGQDTVTLDSGGWDTPTTKSRINAVMTGLGFPIHIFQENYVWYVDGGEFYDGIEFPYGLKDIDTPEWVTTFYGV